MTCMNRKIIFPVLLAGMVTVFALRYYNNKRLEKQVSTRLTYKGRDNIPSSGQRLVAASVGYDKSWKNNKRGNKIHLGLEAQWERRGLVGARRMSSPTQRPTRYASVTKPLTKSPEHGPVRKNGEEPPSRENARAGVKMMEERSDRKERNITSSSIKTTLIPLAGKTSRVTPTPGRGNKTRSDTRQKAGKSTPASTRREGSARQGEGMGGQRTHIKGQEKEGKHESERHEGQSEVGGGSEEMVGRRSSRKAGALTSGVPPRHPVISSPVTLSPLQKIWVDNMVGRGRTGKTGTGKSLPTSKPSRKTSASPSKHVNIWNEKLTPNSGKEREIKDESYNMNLHANKLPAKVLRSKELKFRYRPELGKKYAVVSAVAMGRNYNYVFPLPLTVESWRRLGYETIVLLVGSEEHWMTNPVLSFILKELRRHDPVLLFMDTSRDHSVLLSQVARLFVSELFDWRGLEDATVVLTSDVDIWPLAQHMYDIPKDKKIRALNSECCGSFRHKEKSYKMLPMCSVIMSVRTWRQVLALPAPLSSDNPIPDIVSYFEREFGPGLVSKPVVKGMNDGWFLDQHMISIRVHEWLERHGPQHIEYTRRSTSIDRVDRAYWKPYNLERKKDVHLLNNLYQPDMWAKVMPLLKGLFPEELQGMVNYREGFIRMLLEEKLRQDKPRQDRPRQDKRES